MRAITLLFHDVYLETPEESGFLSDAAHQYKLAIASFDAQLAGVAAVRSEAPIVALPGLQRPAPSEGQPPYLITFDDGGVSYYTLAADRLERRGWRGHCFVTTDMIGRRGLLDRAQIRELDARGHIIGSHSASHPPRFSALGVDAMRDEWARSRETLEDILGHAVDEASVPGGFFSRRAARAAQEAGIRTLFTSEPLTAVESAGGCRIVGRFTIRNGDAAHTAQRFVAQSGWARSRAWIAWNAKGLVKPLLGGSYIRVTHWLAARRAIHRRPATSANAS
jgi:peptidoglycan/xylan/chitin deacetylase (PgdA/CDA1 family)